jgi:hypothetical protein
MRYFIKGKYSIVLGVLFSLLFSFSCTSSSNLKYKNNKEGLKELMMDIKKAQDAADYEKAKVLIMSIIPNKNSIKKALKSDVDSKTIDALNEINTFIDKQKAKVSKKVFNELLSTKLFKIKKEQDEILIHEATTEEIAEYKKDSVAWKEFPGGAGRAAKQILKPKMKFYEVEYLKKGEKYGMKYHLFYWDGSGWKMLGKAWRGLK